MFEHGILQAAMWFGRDGNGAVVYAHTNTLPDWVPIAAEGRVTRTWSDGERAVLEAAADLETWRTADLADHPVVDIGERQVFNILNRLGERDDAPIAREHDGRGYTWRDDEIHKLKDHGEVTLDPVDLDDAGEETAREIARSSIYTREFVFLPVIVEFAFTYYGIHFLLPRQIKQIEFNLFFYDPRNMGGFAAVGQLLKRSYYIYTAGLLLFFVLVYGPILFSVDGYVPGLFELAFFSTAWFVGLLSIGHSMYTIHQLMSEKKERRIRELEAELHQAIENPYDINNSKVVDQDRLDDARRRLKEVRNTRVYPATFTMWSQIAISVLLPQLLQITVQTAL